MAVNDSSQPRAQVALCNSVDVGDLPSGTVTFLFTDIEGSTRLWQERPDDMRSGLEQHDEIVRGSIENNGGYVFATGGDGFAAAFASAGEALAGCASSSVRSAETRFSTFLNADPSTWQSKAKKKYKCKY
jgi:class 3 adenylate cyclase